MTQKIEPHHLHAYLDGELSQELCLEVEQALELDAELRSQLKDFEQLKKQVHSTYSHINPPKSKFCSRKKTNWRLPISAVASLFLGVVIGLGVVQLPLVESHKNVAHHQTQKTHYLVHLDSNNQTKQRHAITELTQLLARVDGSVYVDLISNDKGVELFDVRNPYHAELASLLKTYDNFSLFACKRALERAKEKGLKLELMPQVNHEKPAIDAVVERLNSGWNYIKI